MARAKIARAVAAANASNNAESADGALFMNRELSWLEFNERVLEEALDPTVPLGERCKFISIVASNMDEFFMVRVAGLKQQQAGAITERTADGLSPLESLHAVALRAHQQATKGSLCLMKELLPQLKERGRSPAAGQGVGPGAARVCGDDLFA